MKHLTQREMNKKIHEFKLSNIPLLLGFNHRFNKRKNGTLEVIFNRGLIYITVVFVYKIELYFYKNDNNQYVKVFNKFDDMLQEVKNILETYK